ncbi:MAG: porin family protein [Prevotella sp.]
MKKVFTTMLFAVAMLAAVPAQAQISLGLKGGLNVTNMSFDSDVINDDNREGFFVGPTVKVTLPIVGLGVDASALYDQRDAKLGDEKVSQRSINIPINLRYGIGLGSMASIYLAAGPQFGFNIGQKNYGDEEANFEMKKSNFSINLGAGVSLLSHLEVGFTYNIACGKTAEFTVWDTAKNVVDSSDAKANAWQVSAAYYF